MGPLCRERALSTASHRAAWPHSTCTPFVRGQRTPKQAGGPGGWLEGYNEAIKGTHTGVQPSVFCRRGRELPEPQAPGDCVHSYSPEPCRGTTGRGRCRQRGKEYGSGHGRRQRHLSRRPRGLDPELAFETALLTHVAPRSRQMWRRSPLRPPPGGQPPGGARRTEEHDGSRAPRGA